MGLFLSMVGVFNIDVDRVDEAVRPLVLADGYRICDEKGGPNDDYMILSPHHGNVTVLLPSPLGDGDAWAQKLSEGFNTTAMWLHIHDGDLWMYVLYKDGQDIGRFNPIPAYWDDTITEVERARWVGDAATLAAALPNVDADTVAPYLTEWDMDDESPGKAHPDDEFPIGNEWQVCDFMRRIGLLYPIDDRGESIGRSLLVLRRNQPPPSAGPTPVPPIAPRPRKPWWRFW